MAKITSIRQLFSRHPGISSFRHRHFLNTLPQEKLCEILLFSEGEHMSRMLEGVAQKCILFLNDQRHNYIFRRLLSQGPRLLVNYVYRGNAVMRQTPGCVTVMGDRDTLSLRTGYFDAVVCPFVLEEGVVGGKLLSAVQKVLRNGGRLVLSLRHPQFESLAFAAGFNGAGANSTSANGTSVSQYFQRLKENSLFTENLHEGSVGATLKPYFEGAGHDHFHEYQGTPVSLLFRSVKFQKPSR